MLPLRATCEICGDDCWLAEDRMVVSAQLIAFTSAHSHDGMRIRVHLTLPPELLDQAVG